MEYFKFSIDCLPQPSRFSIFLKSKLNISCGNFIKLMFQKFSTIFLPKPSILNASFETKCFNFSNEINLDDILNIDGIGETQLKSVKNFFNNTVNLNILKELQKILEVKDAVTRDKNGLLIEKTFMVTGKLNGISRAEIKSLIEENSGSSVSTVTKKLDYLIIGDKPTKRKVDKAKELKITILNQSQFLKMLNITS